jgi:hypothetical protein
MQLTTSSVIKIATAIAIAAVVILQALQSNEQGKIEKISEAILTLEHKVSTELDTLEKEEKTRTQMPSASPSAANVQ